MRRALYQNGSVVLKSRSRGPAAWVYRWREIGPQGNETRKSLIIGTIAQIPTRTQALKAAEKYRLHANRESRNTGDPSFGLLIERYIVEERLRTAKDQPRWVGTLEQDEEFDAEALDPSTASSYLSILKVHIRPRWGHVPLSEVKPAAVEKWLRGLVAAPRTKGHIKALMHRLFEKAMLWELLPTERNPMDLVKVKGISRRKKKPIAFDRDQCRALIAALPDPYRTMALVAVCTGMRVSEILALRWSRIHFDRLTMTVKISAVNGQVGWVKTDCSEDELPLDPDFAARLLDWKSRCRSTPGNWVFPSPVTDRCFHASPIQQDYLRPAGRKLGLEGVGWHTFRHTYRTWLDEVGTPIGVQQKLLRHAHPSTTMGYGNALMKSKRAANSKVVRMALGGDEEAEVA
jgi:integrase